MPNELQPRSFKLSPKHIERLHAIALDRANTYSGTVRRLIDEAYEHAIMGIPRCAGGSPCLVPSTWENHMQLKQLAQSRADQIDAKSPV